ncbi:putative DNA-(apurinic or apyrimidinic site) lyase, DNA-formamidopyrimidine glycosylase [Helianthus debilis subsp. tardiflorus]
MADDLRIFLPLLLPDTSDSSSSDSSVDFFKDLIEQAKAAELQKNNLEEFEHSNEQSRRVRINRNNDLLKRDREPELPEVEASRRAIAENCIGKKIIRSVVADGVSRADFEASLTGKTIVGAHRKGKNMWIELDSPPFPLFQFGMAGAIYIKGVDVKKYKRSAVRDTDEWPFESSKLFIELDDGLELSFIDKRRSAKVCLLENPATVAPISELGPDAFLESMMEDELFEALSKKEVAIKTLLLDQSFISGIGDWIADEVLYQAKIHPLQAAASIPKEVCAALHMSLKEVIEHSVEVDAVSSHFPVDWLIHYRWCKKPGKINGMTIEFINAGGRTTAYVPELQKLSGDQAVKVAVKPPNQKLPAKRKLDTSNEDGDDVGTSDDNEDEVKKPAPNDSLGNKESAARKKSMKGKEKADKKVQNGRQTRKRDRLRPSGSDDAFVMKQALKDYKSKEGYDFAHIAAWEVVRTNQKWSPVHLLGEESSGSSQKRKSSDSGNYRADTPNVEVSSGFGIPDINKDPLPRRQKRREKKDKGPSSRNEDPIDITGRFEEYKAMKKKVMDIKRIREEKYLTLADEQRETLRQIMYDKDLETFNRPTDNVHPSMLEIALARKREIAKKYGWPCNF